MGGVDGLAVADHDSLRGRVYGGKNTIIRCHVGGGSGVHVPLLISG
jgi:hypothetical protein